MTRTRLVNLMLLLSMLALALIFRGGDGPAEDSHLLPQVVRNQLVDVRRVHIGKVEIRFVDDGWKVVSSGGYPADGAMVNKLLRGMDAAIKRDQKTNRPDAMARLGLGENAVHVRLKKDAKNVIYRIDVGRQDPRADFGGLRTFVAQGDHAWTVSHLPKISTDPVDWMDPLVWRMNTSRIQALDVQDEGKKPFILKRPQADADFAFVGRKPKLNDKADYIIGAPSFMTLRGIMSADGAALSPRRRLTWYTWDGLEVEAQIFAAADGGLWSKLTAREGAVMADKIEGLDETAAEEVTRLNARWHGFLFQFDDEKMADLMLSLAEIKAKP